MTSLICQAGEIASSLQGVYEGMCSEFAQRERPGLRDAPHKGGVNCCVGSQRNDPVLPSPDARCANRVLLPGEPVRLQKGVCEEVAY